MKLSKRLQTISNLIDSNDYPCDIGCDHAYLSIDLAKRLGINVVATEISDGPYNIAYENIKKEHLESKIRLYKTDGLTNVKEPLNTIIIAGMGSNTMIHILDNYKYIKNIKKIIIQSNKDIEKIREYINKIGYTIQKEYYTYESNKEYITINYEIGNETLTDEEILFGKFDEDLIEYYKSLINKYENIIKEIPYNNDQYKKIKKYIDILKQRIN